MNVYRYGRKNSAYLEAIRRGASVIWPIQMSEDQYGVVTTIQPVTPALKSLEKALNERRHYIVAGDAKSPDSMDLRERSLHDHRIASSNADFIR